MSISGIDSDTKKILRKFIYLFLLLLLFDGALRKWMFISFSAPIMMLKEILAIIICLIGLPYFPKMSNWEKTFFFVGVCVFITTLLFGHHNIIVAMYGCLPYWFGLPICFIIGKILNYQDLMRIGKLMIYTSILNSVLLILQFNLPVEHFLNYQGSEIDERIIGYSVSSLDGLFRPGGLFMHSSQNAVFQMLPLAYMLYFIFLQDSGKNRKISIFALVIQIISLPFAISRTTIFCHAGILAFFFLFGLPKANKMTLIKYIPLIIVGLMILSYVPSVNEALNSMSNRFTNASQSQFDDLTTAEGTLKDLYNRNIVYNLRALIQPKTLDGEDVPFWGFGQGMSTQVGGRLLSINRNAGFSLAEWDGLRIMCESGMIFGWIIIFVRIGYAFRFLFSINKLTKNNKFLSLSLLPVFLISFYLLTNWGNLFQANFAFFVGGLFLVSLKYQVYNQIPLWLKKALSEKRRKRNNDKLEY